MVSPVGAPSTICRTKYSSPEIGHPLKLTAACAFGLEALVKRELVSLGFEPRVEQPGRISFQGDWSAVATANLWLRTADRVLIEVMQFEAADFDALFETVREYDWSRFLPANASFPVTGRSRLSQLTSVPAVQRSVKRAIVESMKREHGTSELPEQGPLFKVDVALLKDTATLTIDTTGPSLHKRGYRKLTGMAPLKETLAAALVDLSVWNPERVLVDPFCGTGTIPIEAALTGLNIAPGLHREFSFCTWSDDYRETTEIAREDARRQQRDDLKLQIIGTDQDSESLNMARYHAKQAGVADHLHFQQKSFHDFRSKRLHGCMITNPPYGERLEDTRKLLPIYQSIPTVFQRVPTWSLFVITNMPGFEKIVQKSATRRRKLFNGRIECTYYQFLGPRPPRPGAGSEQDKPGSFRGDPESTHVEDRDSPPEKPESENVARVFGGLLEKDHEQADLFRARLIKRARHLRRWPTRRNIHCFRLYERDIPEIPLVVDRYGDSLHISRYDRPHDRDLARDAAWLELMKKTAAASLEIPVHRVHVKQRSQDLQQYTRMASEKKLHEVIEGDLKFLVNLTDYVDTGLFLDHRNLRQIVREKSQGKDFLNLFAYTGSFTVYAASGGARSSVTVDLSSNYLDWARKNLELNNLQGPTHRFVASDVIEFLKQAATDLDQRYDLAVVDPPTYSNSKRTDEDWDIQKRHVELLALVRRVIRPGGVVFFSSNFRRFRFDEEALNGYSVREISKQTVPEDFRNKRIHRCWQLHVT